MTEILWGLGLEITLSLLVGAGAIMVGIGSIIAAYRISRAHFQANREAIFNQAVTHLGNTDSASARLGGIYGLYNLLDLEPKRLRSVAEILCAHLRETTQEKEYIKKYEKIPSNEVQSLLNVLSEINKKFKRPDPDIPLLDLSKAYLFGANLDNMDLRGANLWRAQLQEVSLLGTRLQGACLLYAQLQGAHLWNTQLQGANLWNTQLQGANLWNAQLQGVSLWHAKLQGANLQGAQLQGADLQGAQLQGAFSKKAMVGKDDNLEERINQVRGKDTSLETTLFSGGIEKSELDKIESNLKKYGAPRQEVREIIDRIRPHVGKDANYTLPPKSGATTGVLTNAMADKIIADYKKSLQPDLSGSVQ